MTRLAELHEAQAGGAVREIYGEIRRLCAVPMVALIYRHLATLPGALEWAWGVLEPGLRSGELQRQAWALAEAAPLPPAGRIPREALRAAGLSQADEQAIGAVLQGYNRANPVNILALRFLALQLAGSGNAAAPAAIKPEITATWSPPPAPAPLPPMIDPDAMDTPVRALVLLLVERGAAAAGPDGPALWPSLYRHLAHWPAMLGYASVLLPPHFDAIDACAAAWRVQVEAAAQALAARLRPAAAAPAPSGAVAAAVQSAVDRFTARIPEMVIIGALLQRAMPAAAASPRAP